MLLVSCWSLCSAHLVLRLLYRVMLVKLPGRQACSQSDVLVSHMIPQSDVSSGIHVIR
jgi:hypothetical protein